MAVAETQYSKCFDVFYVALVHGGRSAEGNCRRNNYFEAAGVVVEFQLIDLYLFTFLMWRLKFVLISPLRILRLLQRQFCLSLEVLRTAS